MFLFLSPCLSIGCYLSLQWPFKKPTLYILSNVTSNYPNNLLLTCSENITSQTNTYFDSIVIHLIEFDSTSDM